MDEGDRLNRARKAQEAKAAATAEDRREAFTATLPIGDIPTVPTQSDPQSGPPLQRSQLWQGLPQGTEGPPQPEPFNWAGLAAVALPAITVTWLLSNQRRRKSVRSALFLAADWRRRNSPLLIVAGAALIAASLTVLRTDLPYEYSRFEELIDAGWLTFAGVVTALIGIYDKLKIPAPPKI